MRGTKSKRLRRLVYGEGGASRLRSYFRLLSGTVVADSLRRAYQAAKRNK